MVNGLCLAHDSFMDVVPIGGTACKDGANREVYGEVSWKTRWPGAGGAAPGHRNVRVSVIERPKGAGGNGACGDPNEHSRSFLADFDFDFIRSLSARAPEAEDKLLNLVMDETDHHCVIDNRRRCK